MLKLFAYYGILILLCCATFILYVKEQKVFHAETVQLSCQTEYQKGDFQHVLQLYTSIKHASHSLAIVTVTFLYPGKCYHPNSIICVISVFNLQECGCPDNKCK